MTAKVGLKTAKLPSYIEVKKPQAFSERTQDAWKNLLNSAGLKIFNFGLYMR